MSQRISPALELDGVCASYGPYRALFGVTFSVDEGAAVALLGPNGAGKSTVARVASGLVAPSSGRVRVAGRDVTGEPAWTIARAGLSHVPEGRGVFGSLSVEENLVLAFRRRVGRRNLRASLGLAYERFPVLGERRDQRAATLSGGQQRLLSLAKVLVVPPKVLVADELSLGLAPSVVEDVYASLAEVRSGGTALLVVEQQVDRAFALASSAVVLDRGSVAYAGPATGARAAMSQVLSRRRRAGEVAPRR
ncbi:MAG TPA: ATP-binding cassette domain-containing protein [Acidimicrobiales bacterium]|nr:ATP-binding cassette domain-containing protein [Acidimicrobiales bacterium]